LPRRARDTRAGGRSTVLCWATPPSSTVSFTNLTRRGNAAGHAWRPRAVDAPSMRRPRAVHAPSMPPRGATLRPS
jgi:hypothetical protein